MKIYIKLQNVLKFLLYLKQESGKDTLYKLHQTPADIKTLSKIVHHLKAMKKVKQNPQTFVRH